MDIKIESAQNPSKKYFWTPGVKWEKNGNNVKIEIFIYNGVAAELFPDFYFLTQKGATLEELHKSYASHDTRKLTHLFEDFIKKGILVQNVQPPKQLFYHQNQLFENTYSEKIRIDNAELEKFKCEQLSRSHGLESGEKTMLPRNESIPEIIRERRSYRRFNVRKPVPFNTFAALLTVLSQYKEKETTRYYYASAGGLYPIDVYLYIKHDRVENVEHGLYYYNPVDNSINLVDANAQITKDSQYFTNQDIFEGSAFTIYFMYNARVTMPKYDGMGYFYAIIDSGIMVGSLTTIAEMNDIGLCSIGDMKFNKIQKYFRLNCNQVYLHSIELGLKP